MKTFTENQIINLLEEQKQDEIVKYDLYKSEGMTIMEVDWKDGTHECLELSEIAQMFKFAGATATHDEATDEWEFKMFSTNAEWKNYTTGEWEFKMFRPNSERKNPTLGGTPAPQKQ